MSAAASIAPALTPARTAQDPRPVAPTEMDPPRVDAVEAPASPEQQRVLTPQHMQALARANEVRLARAALKREVGAGRRSASDVVLDSPWEAESMTVSELLSAQRRWGRARSRKLILSVGLTETKRLGTLTERQRGLLSKALEEKCAGC